MTLLTVAKLKFKNGWFCKVCDCTTEHREVEGVQVCLACGEGENKLVAQKKAWREANKDRLSAQKKAWREANKDRLSAQKKAYYEANKEKCREATRRSIAKRKAKLQGMLDSSKMEAPS